MPLHIYTPPNTLKSTIETIQTKNKDLVSIALHMQKIINPEIESYNALELADTVESILSHLDSLDINDLISDQKNRQKLRTAFLYELANWIDTVSLNIDSGLRQLNEKVVKSYLKEVFIKQQVQGRDFRSWDSSDLSFQDLTHLPSFIQKEGKDRKFFIVEGQDYWFLIGSANQPDKNPYSFRRFLYEDSSGDSHNKYVYLTHITLKKDSLDNPQYLNHSTYCMTRLYTLDRGVSETLIKFIYEIQQLYKNYLKPLLKKPLEQDGSNPEIVIMKRLLQYEKQLSILILQKLPGIFQVAINDKNDQDYLFYHLDQLMKQMVENLQDFRLQPLAMYSASSEVMTIKLMAMRRLLVKSRDLFCSQEEYLGEHSEVMNKALLITKEKLSETEESLEELKTLRNDFINYNQMKESGSFWQKLKLGRAPDYSIEDLDETKLSVQEELFIAIVRLAKTEYNSMVYPEFECNEIINENYRHYAIADGKLGVSCLPRILRLNEDRSKFDIEPIKQATYQDIFKSNQNWHMSK